MIKLMSSGENRKMCAKTNWKSIGIYPGREEVRWAVLERCSAGWMFDGGGAGPYGEWVFKTLEGQLFELARWYRGHLSNRLFVGFVPGRRWRVGGVFNRVYRICETYGIGLFGQSVGRGSRFWIDGDRLRFWEGEHDRPAINEVSVLYKKEQLPAAKVLWRPALMAVAAADPSLRKHVFSYPRGDLDRARTYLIPSDGKGLIF